MVCAVVQTPLARIAGPTGEGPTGEERVAYAIVRACFVAAEGNVIDETTCWLCWSFIVRWFRMRGGWIAIGFVCCGGLLRSQWGCLALPLQGVVVC